MRRKIKKDNPKEILYEFLNLIGNQEKNLFAPPPVFKKPAGATKKTTKFQVDPFGGPPSLSRF